ncbi:MAG: hypothetical protein JNJ45_12100 [Chthonomonas sp.]|nr:hypothetical protein [Chthonomonas sp.]
MKTIRRKVEVRKLHKSAMEGSESGVQLCFLLQDWEDAYNVGGLFRVADACGADELIMTGRTPYPPHPQIGVTSLGQHRRLPWRYFESHEEAANQLIEEGWTLVAVEIATEAENYRTFDYPAKTCLVLGNEGKGIYGTVMKKCAASVFIPMAGKGRSLNVHVSAAIIAFEARLRVKD